MTDAVHTETHGFQAEVKQLLQLIRISYKRIRGNEVKGLYL